MDTTLQHIDCCIIKALEKGQYFEIIQMAEKALQIKEHLNEGET